MSEEMQNTAPIMEQGYNRDETDARMIGWVTLGTVLFVVFSIIGLQHFVGRTYEQQVYVKVLEPVAADLQDLRAREDQLLGAYSYIDREKGSVNLPIERAMELLVTEYNTNSLQYPTTPYPVKSAEEEAAANE